MPLDTNTAPITFSQLVELWLAEHDGKHRPRQLYEARRLMALYIPAEMRGTPAELVTREQVHALLKTFKGKPGVQRNLFSNIRRIYRWARSELLVKNKPCEDLRCAPAQKRKRVLTDAELRLIWQGVARMQDYCRVIRLLMLTGARRSEIGSATWEELRLDSPSGPELVIAETRYKMGHEHRIQLVPAAVALLPERRLDFPHLFGKARGKGYQGWSPCKADLGAKLGGMKPWRVHDIRRTVRTRLRAIGVDREIAELVIGHRKPGLDAVYDQYEGVDEVRAALQLWSEELARIVGA